VIRVWEVEPPAGVEEPWAWMLLCSLPTMTLADINERRSWYGGRWMVEVYQDIEQNGCAEEDRRLETAEAMGACLAVWSVVAVRVFQLRVALEHQPAAPVATARERAVMQRYLRKKERTVRDCVRGVARLGGFLGRKGDGNPGVRSLWRGYQRLQEMVSGFELHVCP